MSSVVPLFKVSPPVKDSVAFGDALATALIRADLVTPQDMLDAMTTCDRRKGRLADILLARDLVRDDRLYAVMAETLGIACHHAADDLPDSRLIDSLGAMECLSSRLLPLRKVGHGTVIATAYPEDFPRHRPRLERVFGPVVMAVAAPHVIEDTIFKARGATLAHLAETRVAEADSCRSYRAERMGFAVVALLAALVILAIRGAGVLLACLTVAALLACLSFTLLKLAAWIAARRPLPPEPPPPLIARLPTVSLMVALYRESDIAPRLVARLGKLDYPQHLLDVLLVVEAEDHQTRAALDRADLPPWMRMVLVPEGSVKTKPRALNFALDHCRGSIVGVYDAEDAPEPDQIRKVVERFHARGPQVACLQGRLDFYNPRVNWFSRGFTIEYAAWFRLFLPGIARLGLAVPLGGTTLFFRRAVLEELGRWDAHNVTEDADLGIRIARRGYRTELIDTTTFEEANCRPRSWVKQRSRWIKGFMMTWLTHMRDPALLWRELGPRKFLGFQLLLAGSVLQALLAPVLWSFWLVPFGLHHPAADLLGPTGFGLLWKLFLTVEVITIGFGIAGLRRTAHRLSPLWVPTLTLYYPLATAAAYKAAWEMLTQPFYWDKTTHGEFDQVS